MFSFILASIVLWLAFITICNLYPHLKHDHAGVVKYAINAFLGIFLVLDTLFNIIYGSILFLELPKEWVLTMRLRRHIKNGMGWRYRLSVFICEYLIEPWDVGHCKLENK